MAAATAVLEHVPSGDGTRIGYWRSGEGAAARPRPRSDERALELQVRRPHPRRSPHPLRGRPPRPGRERRSRGVRARAGVRGSCRRRGLHRPAGNPLRPLLRRDGGLGAALVARNLHKLVLYEPSPGIAVVPSGDVERIDDLVARGEREEALVQTFLSIGLTPAEVELLRDSPTWSARVAAAHTLAREIRAEEAYRVEPERFRDLAVPALLLLGEESPAWAHEATELIRAALPDARVAVLPGQGHMANVTAPELLADEVARFVIE